MNPEWFLYIKAFHIIFMVTWFAALFYLPRLFVYHAMCEDEISNARFKVMERKLYFGIMTPGAVITIALGLWMLIPNWDAYMSAGLWMHFKLGLIWLLIIYHFWCGKIVKDLKRDQNNKSHVWFRFFNEAPVLVLIAIIILIIVRPF